VGTTSHKRWGQARVVDVCKVAQHVRQVVLAPERMDAPAPPGSHIDIGVYVNGRADVRSYSVVGSGAYGNEIIIGVQLARQSRGGSAFIHQSLLVNGVHAASGSFCWDCGLVRSVPQRGSGGCPVRWRTSCRVMIMVVAQSSMAS
jgi:ferredoxin-NADP reductase